MTPQATVLFVSTEPDIIAALRRLVASMGHEFRVAGSLEEAGKFICERPVDLLMVQTDAAQSDVAERLESGLAFFRSGPEVIAVARRGSIRDAVRAVRAGAGDYLAVVPFRPHEFRTVIERALAQGGWAQRDGHVAGRRHPFDRFITTDYRMQAICELLASVADCTAPLLLEGESGTGKTLLARLLHEHSTRRFARFVEVSCGALSETLLESELFGHVRGAFTSALRDRLGKFELADGGTVLLDEISNASLRLQARLLRVVESGQFERVGDPRTLRSDVRVIAATKHSLEERVAEGRFREDLYHRLNALHVRLLPLRERVEDIPLLARYFLRLSAAKYRRCARDFSRDCVERLVRYPWPGNVRELRNAVEHAIILARGARVTQECLPDSLVSFPRSEGRPDWIALHSLREALRVPERQCILDVLNEVNWNKQHAARRLRISRSTLYKKIREYNLNRLEPSAGTLVSGTVGGLSADDGVA